MTGQRTAHAWDGDGPVGHRVASVTGASAGIGRAIAVAFAGFGWTVAVGARRADRLAETAAEVEAAGGRAIVVPVDVTDADSVDAFFDAIEEQTGPVEVLVNNAGVGFLGAVAETTPERMKAAVETNLLGPLYCTRRATAAMLRHDVAGDVVFISSDTIQKPYPHLLTYGATKAAVEHLAAGLDAELAGTGIRISTVRPGPTVSEFNTGWPDEDLIAFMHAFERLGLNEDFNYIPAQHVAAAVVTAVTAPRGTKVSLLSVRPEVTRDQSTRDRWASAAGQGRATPPADT
jgi:NADP-dependent 3-hydroxy acid dehydrogenase YdfG